MPTKEANIVVLTFFHSITGYLALGGQRLSDFLNDRRETVVRLQDVSVARLNNAAQVIERNEMAVIHKDHAVIVFETQQTDTASSRRPYAFTLKRAHDVFLIMESVEVRGVMHTASKFDILELHRMIATSGEKFVPVTQAKVTIPKLDFNKPSGVMVNVQHIHYIAKTGAGETPKL